MTPARIFVASVAVGVLAGIVFIKALDYGFISLNFQPRPLNVPSDAVEIPNVGKTWMHARCWSSGQQNHCEVFNPDGTLEWNEVPRFRRTEER